GRLLVLDVVVVPRMFAVVAGALAIPPAVLGVEDRSAGLDNGDLAARLQLGELLREHRRGDAAADDADVGFMNTHGQISTLHHGGHRGHRGQPMYAFDSVSPVSFVVERAHRKAGMGLPLARLEPRATNSDVTHRS